MSFRKRPDSPPASHCHLGIDHALSEDDRDLHGGRADFAAALLRRPGDIRPGDGRIFSRQWICVGHQSRLPRSQGITSCRRSRARVSSWCATRRRRARLLQRLPASRDADLRGGARAHAPAMQCPYHAWTYALDGRLLGAPQWMRSRVSRWRIIRCTRSGWSFGKVLYSLVWQSEPRRWRSVFAPLAEKFTHWNLPILRSARRIEYDVAANWKLIFENYSECYHCSLVHPALSGCRLPIQRRTISSKGRSSAGSCRSRRQKPDHERKACAPAVGDITEADHARVFYYSIFPNMLLSLHPDYVMVHLIWPQSPERTLIQCDWFFHPEAAGAELPPGGRDRILGYDEQTGLACLRAESAGNLFAGLPTGALLAARKHSRGVGSRISAPARLE